MIVQILLGGSESERKTEFKISDFYTFGLLTVFVILIRSYSFQLSMQAESLRNQLTIVSVFDTITSTNPRFPVAFKTSLINKVILLQQLKYVVNGYLTAIIIIYILRYLVDHYLYVCITIGNDLWFSAVILWLLQLRHQEQIIISIEADGRLTFPSQSERGGVHLSTNNEIEMVV
jgi:hypothetical protein